MLNWLGGMGIIVLAVAILPMLGVGGTQLFKAEIPGIDKESKMSPRISQVAKKLWFGYTLITILAAACLHFAGMGWFDAVCHALATLSLGGFSTHDASIGYYNSPHRSSHHRFHYFRRHQFCQPFRRPQQPQPQNLLERRRMPDDAAAALRQHPCRRPVPVAHRPLRRLRRILRYTAFNFVSIGLANGLSNTDFAQWPLLISLWMFFLANILASSGSTGGGIKTIRALVLFKFSLREMMVLLHPKAVRTVKISGKAIPDRLALTVMSFIFIYFMTVVLFSFLLMASGMEFTTAFTAVIACITNAGPGLGEVGPAGNYAGLDVMQKWICVTAMLLGRLEIFTVFILFTPAYWKK